VLDRSTDGGKTFTQISPDGDYLTGPLPRTRTTKARSMPTNTRPSPDRTGQDRPNTIYVGTDTGNVWKTTDLGAHWTEFSHSLLPTRWVNTVVVDPTTPTTSSCVLGYREGDSSPTSGDDQRRADVAEHQRRPANAPVEMLTYNQPRKQLFAATDLGVFFSTNSCAGVAAGRRRAAQLPRTRREDQRGRDDVVRGDVRRSVWQTRSPQLTLYQPGVG